MTTARDELPEANQAAPAVGIRLDRTVRPRGKSVTLDVLNYDGNPPRCKNCARRRFELTTRAREIMCTLANTPVHARGVCDSWRGSDGAVLEA